MAKKNHAATGFQPIVNKKALFDYEIIDSIEVGIKLTGPEVKSLRLGRAQMRDSFVRIKDGEAYLHNFLINPYPFARQEDYEPTHTRKLLLHKHEAISIATKSQEKGLSIIPVKVYLTRNRFKLQVGLARGRKQHEKKERIKQRDIQRDTDREMKNFR